MTPSTSPALPAARWRTVAAGAASGLLFALAFPPYGFVVLLPLALTPWIAALLHETRRWRGLASGVAFALAFWGLSIRWIGYVVTVYGGQSAPMGVVSVVLTALILAPAAAMVGWGTVAGADAGSGRRLAAFAVLWVAAEHARGYLFGGFPWNLTAHALFRHPIWLQSASFWGAVGVGGAVVTVSVLLVRAASARRIAPAAAAAALVLVLGAIGAVRLRPRTEKTPAVSVALLQPNLTEESRSTREGRAAGYAAVMAQAAAAAEGGAELIVIPESTLPIHWQGSDRLRADLGAIAARGPMILFNDLEEEPDGRYYNAARLLTPSGLSGPSYRKVHLVPFGEYVPLPSLFFFMRRISTAIGEFTPAPSPVLLEAGPLKIGVGICYEIVYPSLARREVADGANLLATVTNDSWYGRAGAQEQHLAGAMLRAVETDRFLVRAAITGISAIVDRRGRILAESKPDERATLTGAARLGGDRTAWVAGGWLIPFGADAAALAVLVFAVAARRHRPADRRATSHRP